jgi:hypothetical protein
MDSKKFVNLNATYKEFLGRVEPMIKDIELSQSTSLSKLEKVHDDISQLLGGGHIERNDLNHLLINCSNGNSTLQKLKDVVYLRNLKITEKAIKNDKYKDFVTRMMTSKGGNVTNKKVDKAFLELIRPYFGYWDGLWRFIDHSKGKIKSIDVLDPEDIEKFNSYLEKI